MSLVDRILGRNPQGTLHEICALLREQNLLLRALAQAQGVSVAQVPRVQGTVANLRKGPLGADAVSLAGRKVQIQREWAAQERVVAPHRSGPPSDPTPVNAGLAPDSPTT